MRERTTFIALAAAAILILSADRLSAFTETLRVRDGEIFINNAEAATQMLRQ